MDVPHPTSLEHVELHLLLEGIYRHYGYDFRNYGLLSLKRRIRSFLSQEKLATVSGLQEKVLHDRDAMQRLLAAISVPTTAMFRDPSFYLAFRSNVVPMLRTYPVIRIWLAGCSTGEEAYSMAILLEEEGLYERSTVYATDMSQTLLQQAQAGQFPLSAAAENAANYLAAGSRAALSDFYTVARDTAVFHPSLKRHLVFAEHNLVTDSSFNEFNVVLCRNVIIYFNRPLQEQVHKLLYESLQMFGFLGLGSKETLKFTPFENRYRQLDARDKLYRKVG